MTEQRKNQRFALRLPLEIIRDGEHLHSTGQTRNLSSCGVLFTAGEPVEVGESIEYLITFPKARGSRAEVKLRCVGKVLRGDTDSTFAATLERYEFLRDR